jgi:hypothetical protein
LNGKQLATVFRINALRWLRCCGLPVCGFGEGERPAMAAIKGDPALASTPVVLLSIVDQKNRGYALGAAVYLVKASGPCQDGRDTYPHLRFKFGQSPSG